MYDYLVVGAGLYGSIFAHEAMQKGYKVLVIEKRSHVAGNIYTEKVEGINFHKYGAHIFLLIMKKCGNILSNSVILIVLQIVQSLITRENYILCHLICIHLIKCGGCYARGSNGKD